jgi:CDP-diacylglycerol--glycerol-3-phosphate 3-phosphatidyltransferase
VRRHLTLPNQLTFLRLLLVPLVAISVTASYPWHFQVAALIFALATFTDTLDGELARRRQQVSDLGKFLDPLADKVLVFSILAVMVAVSVLPAWVFIVIATREFLIQGLRTVAASQGVIVGSTPWGKSKTVSQDFMIGLLLMAQPWPIFRPVAVVAVALALTATVLSGLDYLWRYRGFVT